MWVRPAWKIIYNKFYFPLDFLLLMCYTIHMINCYLLICRKEITKGNYDEKLTIAIRAGRAAVTSPNEVVAS